MALVPYFLRSTSGDVAVPSSPIAPDADVRLGFDAALVLEEGLAFDVAPERMSFKEPVFFCGAPVREYPL